MGVVAPGEKKDKEFGYN